jgi:hypothetical protein
MCDETIGDFVAAWRSDVRQVEHGEVAVGPDRVAAAVAVVEAGREVSMTSTDAAVEAAQTVVTMWSRSTSMSAAIRCVTWNVSRDRPTLRS